MYALKHPPRRDVQLRNIGCSAAELRKHLESKFSPSMNWLNRDLWKIDFDLRIEEPSISMDEIYTRLNYTNMTPVWRRHKRARIGETPVPPQAPQAPQAPQEVAAPEALPREPVFIWGSEW